MGQTCLHVHLRCSYFLTSSFQLTLTLLRLKKILKSPCQHSQLPVSSTCLSLWPGSCSPPHTLIPNTAHQSSCLLATGLQKLSYQQHSLLRDTWGQWRILLTTLCNQLECLSHADLEVMLYLTGEECKKHTLGKRPYAKGTVTVWHHSTSRDTSRSLG